MNHKPKPNIVSTAVIKMLLCSHVFFLKCALSIHSSTPLKTRHILDESLTAKYSQSKFQPHHYESIIISFVFEGGCVLPSPV